MINKDLIFIYLGELFQINSRILSTSSKYEEFLENILFKIILLASLNNRANQQQQQQQQINNNISFPNSQQVSVPVVQHQINQPPRFPLMQQIPRMNNPPMTRLHEPQKFNQRK